MAPPPSPARRTLWLCTLVITAMIAAAHPSAPVYGGYQWVVASPPAGPLYYLVRAVAARAVTVHARVAVRGVHRGTSLCARRREGRPALPAQLGFLHRTARVLKGVAGGPRRAGTPFRAHFCAFRSISGA